MKNILPFLACFLFLLNSYSKTGAAEKPNILFLLSDDHSVPYLGCYGNQDMETPSLDKLASEGMLFNHAYTTAPQCVPSRSSLLSGRNVLDVQMLRFSAPLDKNIITFPELLREAGYYTGVCGRSYHLDGSGKKPRETIDVFKEFGMETFRKRMDYVNQGIGDKVLVQIKEFLDEVPKGKPFFMWANYSDPHRPFTAPEFEPDPEKITLPEGMPDTKEVRKDLAAHIGEINRLDLRIGQVLDELKQRGLYNNTLIIFMGDNGAALLRGKGTLYDCGLHVPLIARYPELIEPGTKSDILISGSDLGPTILDVAGIKPDKQMTGKSFKHAMQGDETENHEYLFAVRGAHGSGLPGNSSAFDLSRTVFNKEYKLIYNPLFHLSYHPVDFAGSEMWKEMIQLHEQGKLEEKFSHTTIFSPERPMFEFFDIKNDPDEFVNLSGKEEHKKREHEFKTQLHRWMIIYRDVVPLPIPPN
ncbi:sulfatase-like hydrolase/transferase [Maribellus comscasis]|uniref:Sulfatase-like hydrolase/transferase n=1 Tax=Maribellus comscasis TaxID=2681766 RepID=A0A6I6JT91_9BACT|nr:sulfatase [Maribellus comscasis]QGY44298.1 sulfatase-like hydrolase/transferase [Maribellus comscasis]